MELEGGINVTIGERHYKKPFRLCIHNVGDIGDADFWTDKPSEGVTIFELMVARRTEQPKR